LKGALETIMTGLLHRYNLSACVVFSPVTTNELRVQYASGISDSLAEQLTIRLGEGAAGVAYASATRRLVQEMNGQEQGDALLQELSRRQQIRSALFIPMEGDGRAWGVTAYFSKQPNNFSEPSVNALAVFTQQLAMAVKNAQQMADLKEFNKGLEFEVAATTGELTKTNQRLIQKVRELKTIYDLALATAASTNVQDIVQVIIQAVKELIDVSSAAFFLYDKSSGLLEPLPPAFDRPAPEARGL
jgi:GAF domain-containing protein